MLDLIVIKFLVDFAVKPIYIFGGFGLLNFVGAFLAGCWAIYLNRDFPFNYVIVIKPSSIEGSFHS